MNINLNDIPVCVINLPERVERLQRTQLQLDNFYSRESYNFYLIEGVRERNPMKGIAQSHMNCIQLAKDNHWEYVIIIEDDVKFQSENSYSHAVECFKNAPIDFDILLSGVYSATDLKTYNEYWNSVTEFSALHYYCVRNTAYDTILSFQKDQHIDRWLGKIKNVGVFKKTGPGAGLKCYVANPFFAIQFNGHSDNMGQEMNYDHLLTKFNILP